MNKRKNSAFFPDLAGQVETFTGLVGMIFSNHPGIFWPALLIV
ncbi:MAG TPA: hypothetical protein PLL62_07845 [Candidatus Saccharicenans sp.]|nr:hypothetical protein [Candidatus Saccharicenans sp.]